MSRTDESRTRKQPKKVCWFWSTCSWYSCLPPTSLIVTTGTVLSPPQYPRKTPKRRLNPSCNRPEQILRLQKTIHSLPSNWKNSTEAIRLSRFMSLSKVHKWKILQSFTLLILCVRWHLRRLAQSWFVRKGTFLQYIRWKRWFSWTRKIEFEIGGRDSGLQYAGW